MKQFKCTSFTQGLLALALLAPCMGSAAETDGLARQRISGYKVLTTQISASTKQVLQGAKRVAEAQMASLAAVASTIEQMELFKDFGITMGQGAQVCDAVNQHADISRLADLLSAYEIGRVNNAGRPNIGPENYTQARVKQQLTDYCSADQHNLGICRSKYDGMAALSTDYAGLEIQDQLTKKQLKAVNDFVGNLVPPPAPQYTGKCGPSCQSASAMGKQLDTFSSMAALGISAPFTNRIGAKTYAQIKGEK